MSAFGMVDSKPRRIIASVAAVFCAAALAGGCSSSDPFMPTAAEIEVQPVGEADDGTVVAISPSGATRLVASEDLWCLDVDNGGDSDENDESADAAEQPCVEAPTPRIDGVYASWRSDERAVVISSPATATQWVFDFGTGVDLGLDDSYRVLDWAPEGNLMLAADQANIGDAVVIDPDNDFAAEPFGRVSSEAAYVPAILQWVADDLALGASDSGRLPGLYVFSGDDDVATMISADGQQVITDTADGGRLAVTVNLAPLQQFSDTSVEPTIYLYDTEAESVSGVTVVDKAYATAAAFNQDGSAVMALLLVPSADEGSGHHLSLRVAPVDTDTLDVGEWTELATWSAVLDDDSPNTMVIGQSLVWNGGDTAWLLTEGDATLRAHLTDE